MNFDIPMSTNGAMGVDSLMGLMSRGTSQQTTPQPQSQVQPQPQFQSQPQVQPQVQPQFQSQPQVQHQPQVKQRPQGNGVCLRKGQKTNLAPAGVSLQSIKVCLGWDVTNQACDLDASAFMLDANNRVIGDDWFVFYGQPTSPDNSIQHSGDSDGTGYGDDEVITMHLSAINPNVKKVVFVVTIDSAIEKGLNFSMVANAYVRVVDSTNNNELIKFNLSDYYANVTSMVVGEIYNHNGVWKFNAVGDGVAKDLAGLCAMYGVNVVG